jgi:DNA-binding CsgD family transcriptional regulator
VFGPSLARPAEPLVRRCPAADEVPFPQLTPRERDILDGVASGLSNALIGQRLYLSARTVANNVTTILAKLQVSQRAEAIVRAREAGLGHSAGPGTRRVPGDIASRGRSLRSWLRVRLHGRAHPPASQ